MKQKRLWMVGVVVLGASIFIFIHTGDRVNAYFSTVKLQFLAKYAQSYYLYDIDEEAGFEEIYGGYLDGLENSMTYYLEKEDLKAAKIQFEGEYFGTGLKLVWSMESHALIIVDVVKGSMAEEKGLQIGDLITEIDKVPVLPTNGQQLISKATSNIEEMTEYVIKRDDLSWKVELMPTKVVIEDVTWELVDDVLYIKLHTIKEGTSAKVNEILKATDFKECKGLILDVRDLMTHQIEEVAKLSDLFLDSGIAFKVRTKAYGVRDFEMSEDAYEMPMVMITNSETLGGTEALVLALKERVTLLGSNTGGLHYIQDIISFDDDTGMSVAVGKICDRYGKELDQDGVSPSIRLYLDEKEILNKLEHGYLGKKEDDYLQHALTLF